MRTPPALRPGDGIRLVAPSGPFDDALLERGIQQLSRYRVEVPPSLFGRQTGFFAGDDQTRLDELQTALDTRTGRAIWTARGGYGISRLVSRLNWEAFEEAPKWFVGFSDATVIHIALCKLGICSLHAPNGTTAARSSPDELDELIHLLEGGKKQTFEALEPWIHGKATGQLFGGNLTTLFAEAAAGRLEVPPAAVLFFEDVTETSYRVDRMLEALRAGGYFDDVRAVVVGEFTDCSPGRFGVPTREVLGDALSALGVPVLAGLPVGHGTVNRPLLLGGRAEVDSTRSQLDVHSPVV